MCIPKLPPPEALFLATSPYQSAAPWSLYQHSNVSSLARFREALLETCTYPPLPSKLKPLPTMAGTKVTLPTSVPLLPPMTSEASPSPRHQLPSPDGGGAQDGAELTVNNALELVRDP